MAVITGGQIIEGSGLGTPLLHDGAPVDDETFLGVAVVGSRLTDTENGVLYICTATDGAEAIAWTVVGDQAAPE